MGIFFEKTEGLQFFEDKDWRHGRAETRIFYVSDDVRWLIERNPGWKGLRTIVMIESEREEKGKKSSEQRFYISSCKQSKKNNPSSAFENWLAGRTMSLHSFCQLDF
ncbi:MAG: hypothetical protein AAB323_01730 [Pseudomonadota bacterium]